MTNLFEKINANFSNQLPFVAYRKPNKERVSAFLMNETELNFVSNFEEKGFVFAPFSSQEKAILFPEEKALILSEDVQLEMYSFKDAVLVSENSFKEKYITIIEKAIKKIKSGDLLKVVISREECIHIKDFNIVEIYKRLLSTYKNAFVYVWFHPKVGLWFGATPETLLNLEGTTFKTMSLAGTQVYKGNKKAIWGSKELEEQQLVTNFIEKQLENIATNLVIDKTCYINI